MTALPSNLREADAWAARHKPTDTEALDRLRADKKLTAAKLAAHVRAASLVGGEHALDVLTSFADPEGTWPDAVARELLAAWKRFDRQAFARRVFAPNRTLRLQYAGFVDDLSGIEAIPGLETLTVAVKKACSLAPIPRCERLWSLSINLAYGIEDLSPIGQAGRLLSLELWNSQAVPAAQWASLDGLTRLQTLRASLAPDAPLEFLAALSSLRMLDLSLARETPSREDLAVMIDLLRRGVTIHAYAHEPWTASLPIGLPPDTRVHRGAGKVTISPAPRLG